MFKWLTFCAYVVLLCVASPWSHSAKTSTLEFTPADFYDGEKTIHSRIKFPAWDGDVSISVRCDARVSRYGKILENICFSTGDKYAPFDTAVHKAAKNALITPATVDGVKKSVWFQYFVNFSKKGREKRIAIYPNYGLEMEKYGMHYTSPQRYSKGVRFLFNRCRQLYTKVWIKATIDKLGKAKNVEVITSEGGKRCTKNLAYKFSLAKYIPAYLDGKAVPSLYMEAFFNYAVADRR